MGSGCFTGSNGSTGFGGLVVPLVSVVPLVLMFPLVFVESYTLTFHQAKTSYTYVHTVIILRSPG